ncbi:hypothetical protein D3C73_1341120 [compost metagenome]
MVPDFGRRVVLARRALHGKGQRGVRREHHFEAGVAGVARGRFAALFGTNTADDDAFDAVFAQPVVQRGTVRALCIQRRMHGFVKHGGGGNTQFF